MKQRCKSQNGNSILPRKTNHIGEKHVVANNSLRNMLYLFLFKEYFGHQLELYFFSYILIFRSYKSQTCGSFLLRNKLKFPNSQIVYATSLILTNRRGIQTRPLYCRKYFIAAVTDQHREASLFQLQKDIPSLTLFLVSWLQ